MDQETEDPLLIALRTLKEIADAYRLQLEINRNLDSRLHVLETVYSPRRIIVGPIDRARFN